MNNQTALFHKPKRNIAIKVLLAFVLLIAAFLLLFDFNWLRPQLNQTISKSSGSQINIGNIDYSWSNPSAIVLKNIKMQEPGLNVSVDQLAVKVDLWPLFSRELHIEHISLESPSIEVDIERLKQQPKKDKNTETAATPEPLPLSTVSVQQLLISNLSISDVSLSQNFSISGTNIKISNLELIKNNLLNPESHLPGAQIQMFLAQLEVQKNKLGSIKLLAQTETDRILVEQLTVENAPSMIDLSSTIHLPLDSPSIEVTAVDNKLSLDQYSYLMPSSAIKPEGIVTFSASLATQMVVDNATATLENLSGSLTANLQPGKIAGININSALAALQDSQQTSLLDIGGFMLTGPLGLIAGQLFDLGTGVTALGGETQINHLSLMSKIEAGKIDLTNTALATDKYRIALKGKANIITQEFDNFEFAILNDKGCAEVSQSLNGAMSNPTSAVASSLLKSIASPVTDIVSEVTDTVSGCNVFYSGVVQQP